MIATRLLLIEFVAEKAAIKGAILEGKEKKSLIFPVSVSITKIVWSIRDDPLQVLLLAVQTNKGMLWLLADQSLKLKLMWS